MKRRPDSWRPERGFGLAELLITVTLIGALTALALPALNKARSEAKRAACASNLRQISVGFAGYLADHDGVYPQTFDATRPHDGTAVWGFALWSYVGYKSYNSDNDLQGITGADNNIFQCPVTKHWPIARIREIRMPNATAPVASLYSYAMNSMPSTIRYGSAQTPYRLSQIVHPSKTALVLEEDEQSGNWSAASFFNYNGLIPHNGRSNVLFVDGHVELLAPADFPPVSSINYPPGDSFWDGF